MSRPYHYRPARARIIDLEVMKLELRAAAARPSGAAQAASQRDVVTASLLRSE